MLVSCTAFCNNMPYKLGGADSEESRTVSEIDTYRNEMNKNSNHIIDRNKNKEYNVNGLICQEDELWWI